MRLLVSITNNTDTLELEFKVRDTIIARKWFNEVSKNYPLYEIDRFDNWGISKETYIERLNEQIDIINNYQYIIDRRVSLDSTQQDMNYLHKYFEDLRGEVTMGTEWYNTSPKHVQDAVNRFNILIHQLESTIRMSTKHPTLVVTFKNKLRCELNSEDIKHFTCKWEQGAVYINYCHVGKTVLDIFTNNDEIAEAVRPQTHYSADFMVKFGPSSNSILHWFRMISINVWAKFKKFPFKNLNIGMIPVADLVTVVDKETLLKYNKVENIICIK
jgi:hypothetical protein